MTYGNQWCKTYGSLSFIVKDAFFAPTYRMRGKKSINIRTVVTTDDKDPTYFQEAYTFIKPVIPGLSRNLLNIKQLG